MSDSSAFRDERVHVLELDVAASAEPENRLSAGRNGAELVDDTEQHREAAGRRTAARERVDIARLAQGDVVAHAVEAQATVAATGRVRDRVQREPPVGGHEEA
jgi:hypothetical protein